MIEPSARPHIAEFSGQSSVAFLILSICLLLYTVVEAQAPPAERSAKPTVEQNRILRPSTGRDVPDMQQTREPATRRDAVIFIPGMLGSKLMHPRSGKVIWGEGNPSVTDLALDEWAPPATAEILEEYWRGLHGVVEDLVNGGLGDREELVFRFAYDWRQNIDRIAKWFDDRLWRSDWSEELKDKRVHIIAHSMGGLVAARWKQLYYAHQQQRYGFDLASTIVLGAPLQGSCDMLYMLLSGHGHAAGASEVLNYGFRRFFEAAHAAAFTFPSVFQSLPKFDREDPEGSCVVAEVPTFERSGRDHFSVSIWERALVPHLGRRSCYVVARCPVWEDLARSQDRFLDLLARMLETGRKFRESLTVEQPPDA